MLASISSVAPPLSKPLPQHIRESGPGSDTSRRLLEPTTSKRFSHFDAGSFDNLASTYFLADRRYAKRDIGEEVDPISLGLLSEQDAEMLFKL
jgi:hypothetical protein